MGDGWCEICGRRGPDNVCTGCGRTVCDRCYSELHELCTDCVTHMAHAHGKRGLSSTLRLLGVVFIVIGLSLMSLSFYVGSEENGTIVLFGDADGLFAPIFTVIFFAIFLLSSFLPLYLSRKGSRGEGVFNARRGSEEATRSSAETMEYVITTEIPREIADNIRVEAGDGEVFLVSSIDEDFRRRYSIPGGYHVERLEYDYEDNYMILRLTLKRTK